MNFRMKAHSLSQIPLGVRWVSLSLFWTIDMPKARKALKRAEISELRSSGSLPCQRSFVSALELLSSIALSSARTDRFYHVLDGRVFDARNLSNQPKVGAFLTRDWARFRLTKTRIINDYCRVSDIPALPAT